MKVIVGDIFESEADTLVNTVNCVGVMGKGIAQLFKEKYPDNYRDYRRRCRDGKVRPGEPYVFSDLLGVSIINFPTKDHWRSPSRLSYIEKGLDWFVENWESLGIRSAAFPPLGCGNGGLDWSDVGPLMYGKLKQLPIDIEIYAPYGTPGEQLETGFLDCEIKCVDVMGRQINRYNDKWDLILRVIQIIDSDELSLPVGRTVYQKICYIVTREGVATGFTFVQGDYGPYSVEAKKALTVIANKNLIREKTQGKLVRMTVSPSFSFDCRKYSANELCAVEATVDLFSRFTSTRQVEECATLIFAYDELMRRRKAGEGAVAEQEIIEYVVSWKPHWDSVEQRQLLASELFYLTALRWVYVSDLSFAPDDLV